jgi:hypothetical protein
VGVHVGDVKSASYRAWGTCFAPGPGAGVENDVWEESEVQEVMVACEKREERSEAVVAVDWMDVRAEGGREQGGGADVVGGGADVVGGGADVVGGGGGGRRRVLVREAEEPLVEGVNIGAGEIAPGMMDEGGGGGPYEARPLAEPRGWEGGRCGSLGGCAGGCFVAATSVGAPGGFRGRGGSVMGGRNTDGADTSSKDSSRLSPSSFPVPV